MIIRLILLLTVFSIIIYSFFVGIKLMKPEHALIVLKCALCLIGASVVLSIITILF
jgi:hypothetical protein